MSSNTAAGSPWSVSKSPSAPSSKSPASIRSSKFTPTSTPRSPRISRPRDAPDTLAFLCSFIWTIAKIAETQFRRIPVRPCGNNHQSRPLANCRWGLSHCGLCTRRRSNASASRDVPASAHGVYLVSRGSWRVHRDDSRSGHDVFHACFSCLRWWLARPCRRARDRILALKTGVDHVSREIVRVPV